MKILCIQVLVVLLFLFHFENSHSQSLNYIIIKGACYDYGKGPDIPSVIYANTNGREKRIGGSDSAGQFRAALPLDANTLIFRSAGFHDIIIPVRFSGNSSNEVEFSFTLPTSKLDSAKVPIEDELLISSPKSLSKDYSVKLVKSEECTIFRDKSFLMQGYRAAFVGAATERRTVDVQVVTKQNEILMDEKITTDKGFNFLIVDDNDRKSIRASTSETAANTPTFVTRTLYFDQSSHNLSESAKLTLDTIIINLKSFPTSTVKVTGHTDDIGDAAKNLTLSEYRAKVVGNYLETQGINTSRIQKQWFGAKNTVTKTDRDKNMRVVVEVN